MVISRAPAWLFTDGFRRSVGSMFVIAITALIKIPLMTDEVLFDSSTYIEVARLIVEQNQLVTIPHFVYPIITAGMKVLLAADYWTAGLVTLFLFDAALGVILYCLFDRLVGRRDRPGTFLASGLIAVSLMLVAPVFVLAPIDRHFYFGYIGINVFHNATVNTLKPLALLWFWAALEVFSPQKKTAILVIGSAILSILTAAAKPNFSLALLPALALLAFVNVLTKRPVHWRLLAFGYIIPTILILGWQYWFMYASNTDVVREGAIVFAPLATFRYWSGMLLPKFFLSVLFPMAVTILYFRQVRSDTRFVLAWAAFLAGSALAYLLAEDGIRFTHMNFIWGAQVGLFILFVYSLYFFIEQVVNRVGQTGASIVKSVVDFKIWLPAGIYLLHVFFGAIWYLDHLHMFGPIIW